MSAPDQPLKIGTVGNESRERQSEGVVDQAAAGHPAVFVLYDRSRQSGQDDLVLELERDIRVAADTRRASADLRCDFRLSRFGPMLDDFAQRPQPMCPLVAERYPGKHPDAVLDIREDAVFIVERAVRSEPAISAPPRSCRSFLLPRHRRP